MGAEESQRDLLMRLLVMAFEGTWRWRRVRGGWEEADVTPGFEEGMEEDLESYELVGLTSVLGEVVERIILQTCEGQEGHQEQPARIDEGEIMLDQPDRFLQGDNQLVLTFIRFGVVSRDILVDQPLKHRVDKWAAMWTEAWGTLSSLTTKTMWQTHPQQISQNAEFGGVDGCAAIHNRRVVLPSRGTSPSWRMGG